MPCPAPGHRVLVTVLLAAALLSGGCATLDRDPERVGLEPRKTSLWIKPPREDGDTPVIGIRVPW